MGAVWTPPAVCKYTYKPLVRPMGAILGVWGAILGPLGAVREASGGLLGAVWTPPALCKYTYKPLGRPMGAILDVWGAILGPLGAEIGYICAVVTASAVGAAASHCVLTEWDC